MIPTRPSRLRTAIIACWIVGGIACTGERTPTSPTIEARSAGGSQLAAPSALTALVSPPTGIDVAWTDNTTGEMGFEIHGADGPAGTFSLHSETAANVTTISFPAVGYSRTVCYRARAFTVNGKKRRTYSEFSNTACATTPAPPPPPPTAPSATRARATGSTVVQVSWTDNSSNEDGFRVERSLSFDCSAPWELAGTTGPDTESLTDAGGIPEQWLCYRIIAFLNAGIASSPSPTALTVPLAAPTSLQGRAVDHRTIELTWVDNSAVEWEYEVHRATSPAGPYVHVRSVGSNTLIYTDGELAGGTTYWYRVRAARDGGGSDFSSDLSVTTPPLPPPGPPVSPVGVNATPYSSTQAYIQWADQSWNETGFRVEISRDEGMTWTFAGSGPPDGWDALIGDGVPEQRHCYRVIAVNDFGDSPPSESDCLTLIAGPENATVSPDGLFRWTDRSSHEEGFELWYCGPEECAPLYGMPPNTESLQDQWFNASYQYSIVAFRDGGYSDPANVSLSGASSATTVRRTVDLRPYLAQSVRLRTARPPR